jgi:hypothetical protein
MGVKDVTDCEQVKPPLPSMASPGTMAHLPPSHVTGKEYISPASMPYAPSPPGDTTPMETHVPGAVPLTQSRTWSHTHQQGSHFPPCYFAVKTPVDDSQYVTNLTPGSASPTDEAADKAEESFRAAMMAAPRCCTVAMNSPSRYSSSPMASRMGLPAAVPWFTSGYCVDEWFPQSRVVTHSRGVSRW